jgi:hypothetical protein
MFPKRSSGDASREGATIHALPVKTARDGEPIRHASGEFLKAEPRVRMLDEELGFERSDGPSALDLSSIRPAAAARARARAVLLPPAGEDVDPVHFPGDVPGPPREAVAAFAGYPPNPPSIVQAPIHALAVLLRRRTLRRALASARARSSPDIALYEAAVGAADTRGMLRGIAVALGLLACALVGAFVLGETLGLSSPGLRP